MDDPDVYRIPTAHTIIDMLHAVGSGNVEHQLGDASNRATHLFHATRDH